MIDDGLKIDDDVDLERGGSSAQTPLLLLFTYLYFGFLF
jgi:hypothetical protein